MRITPELKHVFSMIISDDSCLVYYDPCDPTYDPRPRVIEFPKVWRENGKQYKVVKCRYSRQLILGEKKEITIRVPETSRGNVDIDCCDCSYTIEYY